jgi:hypothetical protein
MTATYIIDGLHYGRQWMPLINGINDNINEDFELQ